MTNQTDETSETAGWRAATWDGATREAMRRWAKLSLEQIVAAQEEMWELAQALNCPEKVDSGDAHRAR